MLWCHGNVFPCYKQLQRWNIDTKRLIKASVEASDSSGGSGAAICFVKAVGLHEVRKLLLEKFDSDHLKNERASDVMSILKLLIGKSRKVLEGKMRNVFKS